MDKRQIARLMETEERDTTPERKNWWHFRRTGATRTRDAIWMHTHRGPYTPPGEPCPFLLMDYPVGESWHMIPTPPMAVLLRLEPRGTMTDQRVRWQGFHDPDEETDD